MGGIVERDRFESRFRNSHGVEELLEADLSGCGEEFEQKRGRVVLGWMVVDC